MHAPELLGEIWSGRNFFISETTYISEQILEIGSSVLSCLEPSDTGFVLCSYVHQMTWGLLLPVQLVRATLSCLWNPGLLQLGCQLQMNLGFSPQSFFFKVHDNYSTTKSTSHFRTYLVMIL
jgi:hypothetical protein